MAGSEGPSPPFCHDDISAQDAKVSMNAEREELDQGHCVLGSSLWTQDGRGAASWHPASPRPQSASHRTSASRSRTTWACGRLPLCAMVGTLPEPSSTC